MTHLSVLYEMSLNELLRVALVPRHPPGKEIGRPARFDFLGMRAGSSRLPSFFLVLHQQHLVVVSDMLGYIFT